ncbi:MAG: SDR family oxidoreductase [Gammaproteobacteria bacterium]|jgi:2,3-dihydroxy-2,3-dihydro-p-cumate dehydrogenase|nr:SDR family oxidoreductase [Gammaproteobacteria bacterium]MBT3736083.1 SDR family oxidoreductase [Gammaproteobacteria bacterium]MBT3901044.1 SDR family oxidoreductase [Gammaproteobacteria bacterium]MBT7540020.1 SDR family oxidoreductase [Gammaproteobacteria bacterium]MDC6450418.1 SDR family oxidoreductase [Pseudomonadales bacterium]
MQGLSGQTAVISGAASPIGQAIARRLSAEGVRLMLADKDSERLVILANELNAYCVIGDLSDEIIMREMVQQAAEKLGRIDILVNNAGGGVIRPFLEHDAASLTETLNRNLWTALWACHASLPHMLEQNFGRIINIGADSVRNGLWDHAGYNAAKGGVHGLTTGLAREFAQSGVTINTVAPCMVATPMVKAAAAEGSPLIQKFTDVIPLGRPAECDEVASMVCYLASIEASFVTGQVISVNGGSTML